MELKDFLVLNETFYRGIPILDYIDNYELTILDVLAIKNTIMDALIYSNSISEDMVLDFSKRLIGRNDEIKDGFKYTKYPDVMGIPLWMKEEFRKKSLNITGGIPISIFLSFPTKNRSLSDLNTAVSSLFDDFNVYLVNYKSPTRKGKMAFNSSFLEVKIDNTYYLVDNLTRRIFRSDYFFKTYGFDIIESISKSKFDYEKNNLYKKQISDRIDMLTYLKAYLSIRNLILKIEASSLEHDYEVHMSKKYFPLEWEKLSLKEKNKELIFIKNN